MFRRYTGLLLVGFLYLESTLATNWVLRGDTHAASIYYFNILPHSLQNLSYSHATLDVIHAFQAQWPTRLMGSYGIGHREAITETRHIGLYGFIEGNLDTGTIQQTHLSGVNPSARLQNHCYDRFFLNLTIGFEILENPIYITFNVTIPSSAPFTRLEQDYLSTHTLKSDALDKIIATLPSEGQIDRKAKLQRHIETNFYTENNQQWQKYYYIEEGSYGCSITARYHFSKSWQAAFNGYCFYDPYHNFIGGLATRLDYLYSQRITLYTQYTYDAYRAWHVQGGIQFTAENKKLKKRMAYRQLWHRPDRQISPLLLRSHHPRPVYSP